MDTASFTVYVALHIHIKCMAFQKLSIRWPNVCVRIGEVGGGSHETYSVRLKKISEIYGRPLSSGKSNYN